MQFFREIDLGKMIEDGHFKEDLRKPEPFLNCMLSGRGGDLATGHTNFYPEDHKGRCCCC